MTASLLVLVAAGPAAAQGGPYYQISAEADQTSAQITERFGQVEYEVTVRAQGDQSSPFDDQVAIEFTAEYSGTPPAGWSTPEITPGTRQANPGEDVTFTITVGLTSDNPAQDRFRFDIVFTSDPDIPSQVEPLLTGGNEQTDSETVTLTASKALTTSESVTSFADQYKWFLLVGAAGIFLLAIVLVRRKKGVEISCAEPTQEVLPGRGASFPVRLLNESSEKDTFFLSTSELPAGWNVLLPVESIELQSGEQDTVWLTVKSPSTARPGERVQFELFASSRARPGQEGSVGLEAVVVEQYHTPSGDEPFQTVPEQPAESPGAPPDLEVHEPAAYEAPKRRTKTKKGKK